jgi:phosphopantothenoylcysteine decarboxylase/phosphopantothenate--cysteine ligase
VKNFSGKKILLGVSGSISAYRALDLITELREAGCEVNVVMTKDAHHFVTPLSLQSFSGTEVIQDFFSLEGRVKPIHIELAKKSDLILVAPASADIIAKLAHGLADDVLTCTVLASEAPLVVAPAMNEKMYYKKVTQENIEKLKKHGVVMVDPIEGHLVCMDQGMGHLAENKAITDAVKLCLSR